MSFVSGTTAPSLAFLYSFMIIAEIYTTCIEKCEYVSKDGKDEWKVSRKLT